MQEESAVAQNEAERLQILNDLNILDTPSEEIFDRLTALVARLFNVPIALISLVDKDRQWFKSCYGLPALKQTRREVSFCAYAIQSMQVMVVEDATTDPRFAANPLVTGDPHIVFYAGAPLTTKENVNLGTLCLIDHQPRTFNKNEQEMLADFAAIVVEQLQLRLRQSERELLQSQSRFALLFQHNPVPSVVTLLSDGTLLDVNESFLNLLGYDRKEVIGRSSIDFIWGSAEKRQLLIDQLLEKGVTNNIEVEISTRTNEKRILLVAASLIELDGEKCTLTNFTDVTERRHTEMILRETENNLRTVIDNAPIVLFAMDTQGKLTLSEGKGLYGLGYKPRELVGQSAFEMYRDVPSVVNAMHRMLAGENVTEIVSIGNNIFIECSVNPLRNTSTDEIVGAIGVFIDITDRKRTEEALSRTEEQLRQAQKMEAIGRLAGGVAHDFNNLLTGIMGYTEMLASGFDNTPERQQEDLNQIMQLAQQASELTGQLLAFSRKQLLQPKVIDLNHVVKDTEKMLRRLIGEDVQLITNLEPKLFRIVADPGQLVQVIMNLAVNARDAMPYGGQLTIETHNIAIDGHNQELKSGHYVLLSIGDTGTGISELVKEHIFEPFFTTKELGKGTGLGLSTVYGIIKQTGGHIEVNSALEVGTTFRIFLPIDQNNRKVGTVAKDSDISNIFIEAKNTISQSDEAVTILLAEDDVQVRTLSANNLIMLGYNVLQARDGVEALEIYANHKKTNSQAIALLVTDVIMPGGINGLQLATKLTEQQPDLKVLFISGYTGDNAVAQELNKKDFAILHKPFTPSVLLEAVRKAVKS